MKLFFIVFLWIIFSNTILAQDQIVKVNGEEVFGKVIRITPSVVVYKKKDNMDGPEYSETKENILFIKYENGTKDIFTTSDLVTFNRRAFPNGLLKRRNSIFIELGGNNILGSLNYERRFISKMKYNFVAVKAGIFPLIPGRGSIVNITATYNYGDGINYIEVGGGFGSVSVVSNAGEGPDKLFKSDYSYFTPILGYRRQSKSGFMIRAFITMLTMQKYGKDIYGNILSDESTNVYNPFFGFSAGLSF